MTSTEHLEFLGKEPASVTMGVRQSPHDEPGEITFTQQVQAWQKAADGTISLPTFSALIDTSVGSAAYLFAGRPGTEWVVSRLAVTCAPWATALDAISATSHCEYIDEVTGTVSSRSEVFSGGQFLASVSCRSVSASRPRLDEDALIPQGSTDAAESGAPLWTGSLPEHLGLRDDVEPGTGQTPVQLWEPPAWMSNGLGTVQGGMVLSVVSAAAEAAGDAITGTDARVAISDLNLDIMRSPQVSGGTSYRIESTVVRQGRRLIVLSTDIIDADGKVLARGAVTLLSRPAEAGE